MTVYNHLADSDCNTMPATAFSLKIALWRPTPPQAFQTWSTCAALQGPAKPSGFRVAHDGGFVCVLGPQQTQCFPLGGVVTVRDHAPFEVTWVGSRRQQVLWNPFLWPRLL